MNQDPHDRNLEAPANLGAPGGSSLSPRISRRFDSARNGMGRESARMILLSLIAGVIGFFALMVLGNILNAWVW
ncbi:MAG TPA: hypothetical protein VJB57_20680 [Dehalococcoidia bacterium]|nr:hypothetical protein [Dehalococcoidia bacterium]